MLFLLCCQHYAEELRRVYVNNCQFLVWTPFMMNLLDNTTATAPALFSWKESFN